MQGITATGPGSEWAGSVAGIGRNEGKNEIMYLIAGTGA